jgi:hypothetical protein
MIVEQGVFLYSAILNGATRMTCIIRLFSGKCFAKVVSSEWHVDYHIVSSLTPNRMRPPRPANEKPSTKPLTAIMGEFLFTHFRLRYSHILTLPCRTFFRGGRIWRRVVQNVMGDIYNMCSILISFVSSC